MAVPELDVALKALAKDMQEKIPELKKVYEHWPGPKDALEMPCASIMVMGSPRLASSPPTIKSKVQDPDNELNWLVTYLMGEYNKTYIVDLWCEYPHLREQLYEKIADYFDRQFLSGEREMPGLSLELTDYYAGAFACYVNVGYTFSEQEESSQRSEWRVRIEVLANYPRIKVKSEPKMAEIIVKSEIGDQAEVEETNEEIQETYELPEE